MNASTALWVGQVLLAIAFATVGFAHSVGFETTALRRGMGWNDGGWPRPDADHRR